MKLKNIKNYQNEQKEDFELVQRMNIKRKMIIPKAYNKKSILFKILSSMDKKNLSHTLVYCAPGEINEITQKINELGYKVHRFDSKINNKDRSQVLKAFDKKDIQILVAIKCLDEGLDIPNTKTAFFLSSSSNPREFVQRRGRILRKAKEKYSAKIFDFIVLPTMLDKKTFTNIVSKELPRFAEFSKYSSNKFLARNTIRPILEEYDLEYLMDKLPWEVYNEFKEKEGGLYGNE